MKKVVISKPEMTTSNPTAMNNFMRIIMLSFAFFFVLPGQGKCQHANGKKTVLDLAHHKKIKKNEFVKTNLESFNAKIFSVDKVAANKLHHWFIQLIDSEGMPINYADVELTGYFKDDATIKFNYMNPVVKLCSEGKYIIGFVKVKESGIWVLDITIENAGVKDTLKYEIEI